MRLRIGSQSHPAGWALGLPEVLFDGEDTETNSYEYTVEADTLVHGISLPAALIKKIMVDKPNERNLLWRACAGVLLETKLRQDVDVPITHNLQQNVAGKLQLPRRPF